jgi:ABC-type oligopeptide transport system substrate-binding subunit
MGRMQTAAVVVAAALALAGCGGGGSSHTSTTTAAKTDNTTASNSGGDSAKQLDDLTSSVEAASKATFKAVYTSNNNGTSTTVTIEQKLPKSVFITGDGTVINDGTTTYYCSTSGEQKTCVSQSGAGNPLASMAAVFSPQAAITAMKAAHTAVASKLAGVDVSFSSETFGGQDSSCVKVKSQGGEGKYCATKSGILAYSGTAESNFQLTSYSSDVSDSDFALPAGATTVTVPTSNG